MKCLTEISLKLQQGIQKNMTVYKIDYSGVAVKPQVAFNSLKRLVGPSGRF